MQLTQNTTLDFVLLGPRIDQAGLLALLFVLLIVSTSSASAEAPSFDTAAGLARQIEATDLVATTLSQVAMKAGQAGYSMKADELFSEATAVARGIEPAKERFAALLQIALAQQLAGQREAASATVETASAEASLNMLPTDYARVLSLGVTRFFDADQVDAAMAINQRIPDPYLRDENLVGIAWSLIEAGDVDRVLSVTVEIDEPQEREALLDLLIRRALADDHVDLAREAAAELPEGDYAERMRRALRIDQALRDGSLDETLPALIGGLPNRGAETELLADLMTAQARAGAAEEASRTAERASAMVREIEDEARRNSLLEMLAPAIALAGEIETAITLINDLPVQSFERNAAIRASVAEMIAAGDYAKARRLADLFDHPPHRASLYGQIAEALTRAGEPDAALALIEDLQPVRERSSTLAGMVDILANSGQLSEALLVAERIDDELDAATAYIDLARAHARAGDFDAAHATAGRIEADAYRQSALRYIAMAEADAGQFERAGATAAQISHDRYRPAVLGHLAERLAAAGRLQEAEEAAAELVDRGAREEARARLAVAVAEFVPDQP